MVARAKREAFPERRRPSPALTTRNHGQPVYGPRNADSHVQSSARAQCCIVSRYVLGSFSLENQLWFASHSQ